MEILKLGKQAVTVVSTAFAGLGKAQASALGAAGMPLLLVDHPFGSRHRTEISGIAQKCAEQLVALLANQP